MTRKEIEKMYDVNEQGIITSPGKFEGEMIYIPYYWDMALEGFSDDTLWDDDVQIDRFVIGTEDTREFPELQGFQAYVIELWELDNGFVHGQFVTK